MMESHLQATMARIAEIEARLSGMVETPPPPAAQSTSSAASPGSAARPFDIALAQAGGNVHLRPLGGAGPFAPEIEALITKYAARNGLQPELVRAVVQQESGGNPRSVSAAGARGLMQLMPETAQGYGVHDAFDPEQNIAAGTRHLAGLMRNYQGDLALTLAAYNAGTGAVKRYGGVPPYAETQQYVRRIMGMVGRGTGD